MNLIQWSYTRKYQIQAIFDSFPDMVFIFRSINSYYFIFTTKGIVSVDLIPTRRDYVEMELLINLEFDRLQSYINRKNHLEIGWINSWLQKKELPNTNLEVSLCIK